MVKSRTLVVFDKLGNITQQKNIEPTLRYERNVQLTQPCIACSVYASQYWLWFNSNIATIRELDIQGTTDITKTTAGVDSLIVKQDMFFCLPVIIWSHRPESMLLRTTSCEEQPGSQEVHQSWTFGSVNGVICGSYSNTIAKLSFNSDNKQIAYTRVILGLANHVVTVEGIIYRSSRSIVSGNEEYYIGKLAGLVVAAPIFEKLLDPFYRENFYWFNRDGQVLFKVSIQCLDQVPTVSQPYHFTHRKNQLRQGKQCKGKHWHSLKMDLALSAALNLILMICFEAE